MTEERIPVAVVGAGNMGANHIRVYDQLPMADLVEVVESDPDRAATIRDEYDVRVVETVDALTQATAATVAVPNSHHREVAVTCIEAGLDVLVEKPLALNVEDAKAIVDTATSRDAILQVGHIERFNPAVQTLKGILDDQDIIAIEAHRLGPFNEHLTDESVIFDLMIHDLDVIDMLLRRDVKDLFAYGVASQSDVTDHAVCVLQYEENVVATCTASHVTHGKIRELDVTTESTYITLNYQEQDIVVQRHGTEQTTSVLSSSGYRTETVRESPFVSTREPLVNELSHFLDCVANRDEPVVGGREGLDAVRRANEVIFGIEQSQSESF